jgi:ferrous-iron efflux pump FieF
MEEGASETTGRSGGPGDAEASAAWLMRAVSYASVGVASVLVCGKLGAYLLTDSVSILSTLLDSLLDVAASLVNLLAVRHALMPADREHRFGHGKAEPLAGLAQAAFIAGSAAFLMFEVSHRLLNPQGVTNSGFGIAVVVASIVLTVVLVMFQRHVIRRTRSISIRADSLHYVGDVLVNGGVLVALVLSGDLGWRYADPVIGAAIALYILYIAWRIARGSYDMLMDRELSEDQRRRIGTIVLSNPAVRALHDLKTREAGRHTFIQLHIEMDGAMSLIEAHRVSDEVEAALEAAFPGAEIIIHQDPAGVPEKRSVLA